MSIKYARDVRKHFHTFVAEGFARYAEHPATAAATKLADELLHYCQRQSFTYQLQIQNIMTVLRDEGVTARDVLIRVAEFVCWLEANPGRLPNTRAEDYALARLVIFLVNWKGASQHRGANVLKNLGVMIREAVMPYAVALVRKLKADLEAAHALRKQSADLG